jgi:predicted kinase
MNKIMEMIMLIGVPGSGKSTFFKENFFHSHVRVSLDLLRTKNRERKLLEFCFETSMPFVLDNTNVSAEERKNYIESAKSFQYKVRGYYFRSDVKKCLERNSNRQGRYKVPEVAIFSKYKELQIPSYEEGFDELLYVEAMEGNSFNLNEWKNEI